MKFEAGPMFGAVLVGGGSGYMVYKKTGNPVYGVGAAIAICVGEYLYLIWANSLRKKK